MNILFVVILTVLFMIALCLKALVCSVLKI